MQGTMVACLSCKQIVWAYDANFGDVRGLFNMMKMPCRLCGVKGNYDGWRINDEIADYFGLAGGWQVMKRIAAENGFEWNISGTNEWFTEPDNTEQLAYERQQARELEQDHQDWEE